MEIGWWKTALSYLFGVVALGCLVVGIVSEVLEEEYGLTNPFSWYYIAIAVFVGAAWLAILRLRSPRSVRSIPPESE